MPTAGRHAAVYAVLRRRADRLRLRVDRAGDHRNYWPIAWPELPPAVPYAVDLADDAGRFWLVPFDLDPGAAGTGAVAVDEGRLVQLLDDAGVAYVLADSGPAGGRHVWTAWAEPLPAERVAVLARGLARLLPTLDTSALLNPGTGCLRPPGAPHRHGGTSRLDPRHADDAAAAILATGTPASAFEELLAQLPATGKPDTGQTRSAPAPRAGMPAVPVARRSVAIDVDGAPRLPGRRRALTPAAADRARTAPVNGDHSAQAFGLLVAAALARWSRADVAALVADPAYAGLEHLRSRRGSGGAAAREPRPVGEAAAVLARQWARAVDRAAELDAARGEVTPLDDARVDAVTATVAAIEDAVEADRHRWAAPGGPADEAVLRALCRLALAGCTTELAADVRRLAELTGHCASTAAAALRRLAADHPVDGPAWITLAQPAEGRRAAVWTLPAPAQPAVDGQPDDQTSRSEQPQREPVDTARTQGLPAPRAPLDPAPRSRAELAGDLAVAGEHAAHDCWTHGDGLGHHTARTHAALLAAGPTTVDQLASRTGYTRRTVRAHLDRLRGHQLAATTRAGVVRPGSGSLDDAADQLGVTGTGARRAARHELDRELHAWWCAEQAWRTAPKHAKPLRRRPRDPGQRVLILADGATPLTEYGAFPTRVGGRAHYTRAADHLRRRFPILDPTAAAPASSAA